jgi:NitT/TauT family transport system substrate-binding protein
MVKALGQSLVSRWRVTSRLASVLVAMALCAIDAPAQAEHVRVSATKIASNSAMFVAMEKGYFAAEGLEVDLVSVENPAAMAAAVASGDVDFSSTGNTAATYALAGQGILRLIAAQAQEAPTFRNNVWVASRQAYDAGLKTFADLPGHTYATTSFGSPGQYVLSLMARKMGFDASTLQVKAMQSSPNSAAALASGQVDCAAIPMTFVAKEVERGSIKVIGWVGDETPWQVGAVFTSSKIADERRDLVEHFLRAYRKGARDYHGAFTAPNGTRQDQATAPEILAILAKYLGQPLEQVSLSIPYIDAQAALDRKDILNQVAWYKSQNMLKDNVDASRIIDLRYAILLPEH